MYRLFVCIAFLTLAGCAPQYPLNTDLQLAVQPEDNHIYEPSQTAAVISKDSRATDDVIVYRNKKEPVEITNIKPLHAIVADQLSSGLRQQGLTIDSNSPMVLLVDIRSLKASVTRPEMVYHTKVVSQIRIELENQGKTLGKKYNIESNQESLTRPKVAELEDLLETQLSDIVSQILADEATRSFIKNR